MTVLGLIPASITVLAAGIAIVAHCAIAIPPQKYAADAMKYFGRAVFLTIQTQWILLLYGILGIVAAIVDSAALDEVVLRVFPLAFALGFFLSIGYYALDHNNPEVVARRLTWAEKGYPRATLAGHCEHALATPTAIVLALTVRTPSPRRQPSC